MSFLQKNQPVPDDESPEERLKAQLDAIRREDIPDHLRRLAVRLQARLQDDSVE